MTHPPSASNRLRTAATTRATPAFTGPIAAATSASASSHARSCGDGPTNPGSTQPADGDGAGGISATDMPPTMKRGCDTLRRSSRSFGTARSTSMSHSSWRYVPTRCDASSASWMAGSRTPRDRRDRPRTVPRTPRPSRPSRRRSRSADRCRPSPRRCRPGCPIRCRGRSSARPCRGAQNPDSVIVVVAAGGEAEQQHRGRRETTRRARVEGRVVIVSAPWSMWLDGCSRADVERPPRCRTGVGVRREGGDLPSVTSAGPTPGSVRDRTPRTCTRRCGRTRPASPRRRTRPAPRGRGSRGRCPRGRRAR